MLRHDSKERRKVGCVDNFWALLAVRLGFALMLPFSIAGLLFLGSVGTLLHGTYLLTLTLCCSQLRLIVTSLTKAALVMVVACLTGPLLPVFAAFGLVISILQCAVELTEPILRIRYQRQLRKLQHLHKLLIDPVLVETLQQLLRGAGTVTTMAQRQLANSAKESQRRIIIDGRGFKRISNPATAAGEALTSSVLSTEMVEQLVTQLVVSANSEWLAQLQEKTSPALWQWTRQQYIALKQSGMLEAAAQQALQALQGELEAAADFLPYLNAIEKVRKEQQERVSKERMAALQQKQKQRRRQQWQKKRR